MTTMTDTVTLWVCVDCLLTDAAGQYPEGYDEDGRHETDPDRNPPPWSIDQGPGMVTQGLTADEHLDDCPNLGYLPCPAGCDDGDANPPDLPYRDCPACDGEGHGPRMEWDGSHDEPCEDEEFSWSRCDGCGSTLGGSRHAYTYHLTERETLDIHGHVPERGPWG